MQPKPGRINTVDITLGIFKTQLLPTRSKESYMRFFLTKGLLLVYAIIALTFIARKDIPSFFALVSYILMGLIFYLVFMSLFVYNSIIKERGFRGAMAFIILISIISILIGIVI